MELFTWFTAHYAEIVTTLVALNVAGQALARWTPSKADDAFLAKVEGWLKSLGSLGLRSPSRR